MQNLTMEDELALDSCSPFIKRIQDAPIPNKFKMSTLAPYDDTMDHIVHITNYNTTMKLHVLKLTRQSALPSP